MKGRCENADECENLQDGGVVLVTTTKQTLLLNMVIGESVLSSSTRSNTCCETFGLFA